MKLKLCPFCDNAPELSESAANPFVYCAKCDFQVPIDTWQTRGVEYVEPIVVLRQAIFDPCDINFSIENGNLTITTTKPVT